MFSGIIVDLSYLIFNIKFNFRNKKNISLILKNNCFSFLDLNIGDSISLNGFCSTLIFKNLIFFEFELFFKTFLNIFNIEKNKFFNIEKSLRLFNNINGYLIFGHINNIFFLKKKYFYNNNFVISIFVPILFRNYIIYKGNISLNGVSLTINEIEFFKNFILVYLSIINFTYFFTNFYKIKVFDFLNSEFDLNVYYILNFLYF